MNRRNVKGVLIGSITKGDKVNDSDFFAVDTNALNWEQRTNPHLPAPVYRKVLHTDAETGVFFQLVRYPRGVINPSHTHPCAHAIYVLEGTLVTHRGNYGPGAFVWFPEGLVMEHGAGTDGDVTVLLVSNKPFAIQYVGSPPVINRDEASPRESA